MSHDLIESLGVSDTVSTEKEDAPVLNIFVGENEDQPGTFSYNAYDSGTGHMEHSGFATEADAVNDAVATYKAKRQVTVLVTVELEDPHMKIQDLVDMISGRAATIQGVNAMKAEGYMQEDWFEAPHVQLPT